MPTRKTLQRPADGAQRRGPAGLLHRVLFGRRESVAQTVYGTIVVMAAIAAGSRGEETDTGNLAALTAVTAFVLFVAHVYSHALAESLQLDRRLDSAELTSVARRELAIVLAAVAPVAMLLLGAAGVFGPVTAIRLALAFGVATLAVQGFRFAALERLRGSAAVLSVGLNVGLGLAIVALEVLVAH